MNMKHIYTILIFALMAAGSAFAASDFSAYSLNTDIKACACGIEPAGTIVVENRGSTASGYVTAVGGSAARWAAIVPSTFTLEAGRQTELQVYITSGCDTRGAYELTIKIMNQNGNEEAIQQQVTIKNCQNVNVLADSWGKTSYPCTPTSYALTLQNTGSFAEVYDLSTDKNWLTPSEQTVFLGPHESYQLALFANPPCENYGLQEMWLAVEARKSSVRTELPLLLDIVPRYNYTLQQGEYSIVQGNNTTSLEFKPYGGIYSVCENMQSVIPVKATNLVQMENTYKFSLEGQKWGYLGGDTLALNEAFPEGLVEIAVEPLLGERGNYSFLLKGVSMRGDREENTTVEVEVKQCFGIGTEVQEHDELCTYHAKSYPITVKNTGAFEEHVLLGVKGKCASISSSNMSIAAGGEMDTELTIDENCAVTGKQDIIVEAVLANETRIRDRKTLTVDFTDVRECFKAGFSDGRIEIMGRGDGTFMLKNDGSRNVTYELSIEAPDWMKLQEKSIPLAPGSEKAVKILFTPGDDIDDGLYSYTVNAAAEGKVQYSKKGYVQLGEPSFFDTIRYYLAYAIISAVIVLGVAGGLVFFGVRMARTISSDAEKMPAARAEASGKKADAKHVAEKKVKARKAGNDAADAEKPEMAMPAHDIPAAKYIVLAICGAAIVSLMAIGIAYGYLYYILGGTAGLAAAIIALRLYDSRRNAEITYAKDTVKAKHNGKKGKKEAPADKIAISAEEGNHAKWIIVGLLGLVLIGAIIFAVLSNTADRGDTETDNLTAGEAADKQQTGDSAAKTSAQPQKTASDAVQQQKDFLRKALQESLNSSK